MMLLHRDPFPVPVLSVGYFNQALLGRSYQAPKSVIGVVLSSGLSAVLLCGPASAQIKPLRRVKAKLAVRSLRMNVTNAAPRVLLGEYHDWNRA